MNYAQTFLMANMQAFPAERLPFIQQELEGLEEQDVAALLMTDIKNPTTALLLALFLGEVGADRFYIGNKELGIAKLVLTVLGFVTLVAVVGFFLLLGVFVWKIVDCCLIMGACREANFERLMLQLGQIKSFRQAAPAAAPEVAAPVSVSETVTQEQVETPSSSEMAEISEKEAVVEAGSEVEVGFDSESVEEEPLESATVTEDIPVLEEPVSEQVTSVSTEENETV